MKSIRHTLIVYFLLLLTTALAAVSWSSYRTTAHALRERQNDSRKLIEKQCEDSAIQVKNELDRRILRQAGTMAETPQSTLPYEATHVVGMFGALSATTMPQGLDGYLCASWMWAPLRTPNSDSAVVAKAPPPEPMPTPKEGVADTVPYIPLWFFAVRNSQNPQFFGRAYPRSTNIQAEALVAKADQDHPQEYFQTYNSVGQPIQRSSSLGDQWFTLEKEFRDHINLYEYDEAELQPGVKVKRVTLKISFSGTPWWNPPRGKGPNPKGMGQASLPPRPPPNVARPAYIQYAADLRPLDDKVRQFQQARDEQLIKLGETIEQDLAQLRNRMLGIGFGTLIAVLLGGFGVIRLGLAPLAKMTEAVRQVSPTNFHLPLEAENLPYELRPIATRIEESLQELRKAFAREKQAAADISHELRTPLAALMTTLEVGLKKNRSGEEYRDILDECRASGQHMYQLVERLLTLARLDAGADQYRPSDADVTEIALTCADIIRPLARARGLEMRLHLPDPIIMRTDANKLREVLINLMHNAVEYNKPSGSIELAIERSNGHVRLEVRDTGIGISPQALEHIFERFYRADPSRHADTPHAGLGLAIVKSYVDLMGGTIRVESNGAGTAFIVELPFVEAGLATAIQMAPVLVQR